MLSSRVRTVAALGTAQTLAWASSYYLPAILAVPIARELGIATPTVFAAFSAALVMSALLGPHAGQAIDRWGGRPVLSATSLVFAAGLVLLGLAHGVVALFAAWLVLGVGMGSGLYEGAFAALVRLEGRDARRSITGITLLAGFASTVGWPLTSWLAATWDWRTACFAWAALHLLVGLPLNGSLPRARPVAADHARPAERAAPVPMASAVLLSSMFAATLFVSTAMAAHLPRLLQLAGASAAGAIAVGALVGPAQVAARLFEYGVLRRVHPLWSARLATAMHPIGAAALGLAGPIAAPVFGVLHGAGNGILTIAKGTLPLALFGPAGYGQRQGVLMVPARITQALAPWVFGVALDRWGAGSLVLSSAFGIAALGALLLLRPGSETAARPLGGTDARA
ncbi:MAG: MFS transporter [Ramlibacter sp.]